jgi:glycerol-3-phosphate acyltransferase PlsY
MKDMMYLLEQNSWLAVVVFSLSGYLIGSVSFARLIYRMVKKSKDYEPMREKMPGTDFIYESNLKSASWVGIKVGKKYGCLTSVLDMLKVGIPVLLVKLFFIEQPYYLLLAFFGVVGHNFPVYHRFNGGRGESPIIGSILVIDWLGMIVSNLASAVLGFLAGSVILMQAGWKIVIIFWFWFYRHDYYAVVFMIAINLLFGYSMRKEIKMFVELKSRKDGFRMKEEDYSEGAMMGKKIGRMVDNYNLVALTKKLFKKTN